LSQPLPATPADTKCPVCGRDVPATQMRCPTCGYHVGGLAGRPGPWTRAELWWTAAFLLAVYAVTLVIVALAR
jgi:hypothetical protein